MREREVDTGDEIIRLILDSARRVNNIVVILRLHIRCERSKLLQAAGSIDR
jgi:hypothetical protein